MIPDRRLPSERRSGFSAASLQPTPKHGELNPLIKLSASGPAERAAGTFLPRYQSKDAHIASKF
jgi:hypothetical protein